MSHTAADAATGEGSTPLHSPLRLTIIALRIGGSCEPHTASWRNAIIASRLEFLAFP
jgi:hypothetical protein